MDWDRRQAVPSTFFIGVRKGRGLTYGNNGARYWIDRIRSNGFEVGLHGIEYDDPVLMVAERCTFSALSGLAQFGIRIHYLMKANDTLRLLNSAGYTFDSTRRGLENPYRIGRLWEFPLHIMDGDLLFGRRRWQTMNLEQCREATLRIVDAAENRGLRYLTVLFHDRYFCDGFGTWKAWYQWSIDFFKSSHFDFVSYSEAMRELEL